MTTQHEVTTLNVSMPVGMRRFVEAEVARGQYTSASEYLRELIRKAQQEQHVLDIVLPAGVVGGPPPGVSAADWAELRNTLRGLKIDELRRNLDKAAAQLDRGEGKPLDIAAIKSEGRRRLKQRRKS